MDYADFKRLYNLIEPCQTPEELDKYLAVNFNIRLPWDVIDEKSTSAPLQFVWHVYNYMLTGEGDPRHVLACSRNSAKTLTASMIQYFSMLHFRRDGAHVAATLDQSAAAIGYLNLFLNKSSLADYKAKDNTKTKRLEGLPANDFTSRQSAKIQVITASKKGANAPRASCLPGDTIISATLDGAPVLSNGSSLCARTLKSAAEDVMAGKKIYVQSANNKTGDIEIKRVVAAQRSLNEKRILITTESGRKIESTEDHWHSAGIKNDAIWYSMAKDMSVGDPIFVKSDSGLVKLDRVKNIERFTNTKTRRRYVYDITVEDNHNFFANGVLTHNCITFDELDLTPREIISEVAYVADPSLVYRTQKNLVPTDGMPETYDPNSWYLHTPETEKRDPVYIYLSSRKSNNGPIQDLIDEAQSRESDDISLHMWSMVDWMEKCPPEVHKPDNPISAYMNIDSLKVVWGKERFDETVSRAQKDRYREIPAYEGCMKCPAFVACQGRSPNQRGTSPMLRSVSFTAGVLKNVGSAPAIIAQGLNEKPETTGLVFPTFERYKHFLAPIDFYEFVSFGEKFNPMNISEERYEDIYRNGDERELKLITPTKTQIYEKMIELDYTFTNGVDYGGVDTATSILVGRHEKSKRTAVLHVEAEAGHGNESWSDHICLKIFPRFPFDHACPDIAAGGGEVAASYFKKHGIHALSTKPNRIEIGVSQIRDLLWDVTNAVSNFAILDDFDPETNHMNQLLARDLENWTHKKDALGRYNMSSFADDEFTHTIDALRYAIDEYAQHKTKAQYSVGIGDSVIKNRNDYVASAISHQKAPEIDEKMAAYKEQIENYYKNQFGVDVSPQKTVTQKQEKSKKSGIKFRF